MGELIIKFFTKYKTGKFCDRPRFIYGLANTLNIAGNFFDYNPISDEDALRNDWCMVGQDIGNAMYYEAAK
jgi:hypothetical protein